MTRQIPYDWEMATPGRHRDIYEICFTMSPWKPFMFWGLSFLFRRRFHRCWKKSVRSWTWQGILWGFWFKVSVRAVSSLALRHDFLRIQKNDSRDDQKILGYLGFVWLKVTFLYGFDPMGWKSPLKSPIIWGWRLLVFFPSIEESQIQVIVNLGGSFKYVLFSPLIWGRFPIWPIFFQMGWNHQPGIILSWVADVVSRWFPFPRRLCDC